MRPVRAAALITAAALIPFLPAAAHADRYQQDDASADVLGHFGESDVTVAAPERANGDILSSTVAHKRQELVMRLEYRDLVRDDDLNHHIFKIRTSHRKRFYVALRAREGIRGGRVTVRKGGGERIKCQVDKSIDYAWNTASVAVPRSCLGNPRWVKVGMWALFFPDFGTSYPSYFDDARDSTFGDHPALSPRIRR